MNASQVISGYESLANLSGQMREAAVQGEWDKLIELEQEYLRSIAEIKPLDEVDMDAASNLRKAELIKKILANDAEIRNRTKSWMDQLQRNMQSNRQELRLNRTYIAI